MVNVIFGTNVRQSIIVISDNEFRRYIPVFLKLTADVGVQQEL